MIFNNPYYTSDFDRWTRMVSGFSSPFPFVWCKAMWNKASFSAS